MKELKEMSAKHLCAIRGEYNAIDNKTHTRSKKNFISKIEKIQAELKSIGFKLTIEKVKNITSAFEY